MRKLLILLSLLCAGMAFGQVENNTSMIIDANDPIHETSKYGDFQKPFLIEAIEIKNVCKTIDTMIYRHIFVQKQAHCKWNQDNDYLLIRISPFYDPMFTDSAIFNLLYSINDLSDNLFETKPDWHSDRDTVWYPDWNSDWRYYQIYSTEVYFVNKDTREMIGIMNNEKVYFFKHEKCNVFILSPLLPLTFEEVGIKMIEFDLKADHVSFNKKCDWQLARTFYNFTKDTLKEIRYRDIMNVPCENKEEMFK